MGIETIPQGRFNSLFKKPGAVGCCALSIRGLLQRRGFAGVAWYADATPGAVGGGEQRRVAQPLVATQADRLDDLAVPIGAGRGTVGRPGS